MWHDPYLTCDLLITQVRALLVNFPNYESWHEHPDSKQPEPLSKNQFFINATNDLKSKFYPKLTVQADTTTLGVGILHGHSEKNTKVCYIICVCVHAIHNVYRTAQLYVICVPGPIWLLQPETGPGPISILA